MRWISAGSNAHRVIFRLHLGSGTDHIGQPVTGYCVNLLDCLIPVTVVIGFFQILNGLGSQAGEWGKFLPGHVKPGTDVVHLPGEVGPDLYFFERRLSFRIIFDIPFINLPIGI